MAFSARTATVRGTIVLDGPVEDVFPLFSPLGEREWVDGWDPEILAPSGASWEAGMIFRTRTDGREDVWVVAALDRAAHRVLYYRTEPGHLVARVEVECRALDPRSTEATTSYSYVGLSDGGNTEIAAWTDAAYAAKMQRWQDRINQHLRTGAASAGVRTPPSAT